MNREIHWTSNMLFFRGMVEEAEVLAWITVADGYCAYYSPAWYSFTGTPAGSNLGMSWLELLHPEDRVTTRRAFFEANDGGEEYAVSYRLKKSDGTYQRVWGHGLPCFDNKGRFIGYLGMTQPMEKYASPVEALTQAWSAEAYVALSPREKAVFALIAQGYKNEDVAAELGVSLRAVESSVAKGTAKLGAANRVHAVVKAIKLNEI
jgi:PAS domain S-box-containing protein